MRIHTLSGIVLVLILVVACTPARKSSAGFHLPDGDPECGKVVFFEMKCNTCHHVAGVQDLDSTEKPQTPVILGGRVRRARTDGELFTSIVDPSFKLATGFKPEVITAGGRSRMPDSTHALTVRQMIDLVAFLQAHYEIEPPPPVH